MIYTLILCQFFQRNAYFLQEGESILYLSWINTYITFGPHTEAGSMPNVHRYYSAGKRDRGKNSSVPLARAQQSPPCQGQGGAEGPDADPFGEEGAEGPRRLGRTSAPLGKSFRRKLKTGQRYYTRLRKNRKSAI